MLVSGSVAMLISCCPYFAVKESRSLRGGGKYHCHASGLVGKLCSWNANGL